MKNNLFSFTDSFMQKLICISILFALFSKISELLKKKPHILLKSKTKVRKNVKKQFSYYNSLAKWRRKISSLHYIFHRKLNLYKKKFAATHILIHIN